MSDILSFEQIGPKDRELVGGKALSLGLLAAAGFPVPPGFCVTTTAYRRLGNRSLNADQDLCKQITDAYHRLGGGRVAVRSSATMEDSTLLSFAGQQETILGVEGEVAIVDAIARCWASLRSERAIAYRQRHGIGEDGLAMAVVVQQLVPAEVSGVLFTRDPLDPDGRRMLVEASWGLGESVVSGRVTPDRFHLDREAGTIREQHSNPKTTLVTVTGRENAPVEKQTQLCLCAAQLAELAELGRRVEAFYGDARDVEWAWAAGSLWLLQARPITTGGAAQREQVRREEIAALRAKADPRGTVWSRYNLSESLPAPTPMTWSIVRRFLSGKGGLGLMYRDLGFRPDPALDEEGIYDLVCGRPYCNLSREPGMYRQGLPLEHSFAALKAAPEKAFYPQAELNWRRAGWRFWLFFPVYVVMSLPRSLRLGKEQRQFSQRFRQNILPAFVQEIARGAGQDYSALLPSALLEQIEFWIQRTLYEFARDSLKPTVLAACSMAMMEQVLAKPLGPVRSKAAVAELSMGARPDPEADLAAAIRDLAAGKMDRSQFLERFGHRGDNEMELASPRWAEDPKGFERLITTHQRHGAIKEISVVEACARLADELGWTGQKREHFLENTKNALPVMHSWLGLRETAKHYLMQGYALIRRILVELDRRYHLDGGIFYLVPEELPRLVAGEDLSKRIAERRRRQALALSLEVPPVLYSDDLEAIGRPLGTLGSDTLQGVPLSPGVAEGPALVLQEAAHAQVPAEPYILVCPSTDPAWVPLFVHARGLIVETGGVLSHGAIVAREFGLPAVAGLPGIHRRLRGGQHVHIDGTSGIVTVIDEQSFQRM